MNKVSLIANAMVGALTVVACDSSSGGSPKGGDASTEGGSSEPVGCAAGADAGGGYNPTINPADFPNPTKVDNPYFPLVPGTIQHLVDTDHNIVDIEVTSMTKKIQGIDTVVVHDTVKFPTGEISEDTTDWFAQDKDGNVWYFGETTMKRPTVSTPFSAAGTWVFGQDCAKPGYVMKAHPMVGDSYRQEFYAGNAEDQADVLALDETVTVPYGTFQHCLRTKDYTRFSPGADENKFYCPGLGNIKTIDLPESMNKHEDLVSITFPSEGGAPEAGVDAGPDGAGDGGGPSEAGADGGPTEAGADVASDAPVEAAHD
jgi:hypothetical protein